MPDTDAYGDPDVAAIDRLLDLLKAPAFTSTTLDMIRRELRTVEVEMLQRISPDGLTPEEAQAARQAITEQFAALVALADPSEPGDAPRSIATRRMTPLGRCAVSTASPWNWTRWAPGKRSASAPTTRR